MLKSDRIDLYTHAGVFHADDVFSAAFLRLIGLEVTIHRVNEVTDEMKRQAMEGTAVIADIGMEYDPEKNLFDHHQEDKPVRSNGVPYAAFGLLAEHFWRDEWDWKDRFETEFIQQLDRVDNNGGSNPVCKMIKNFLPAWNETADLNAAFDEAVDFAFGILSREFKHRTAKREGRDIVWAEAGMAKNGVVVLEQYIPFDGFLDGTCGCKAVVYPSTRGGYDCRILSQFTGNSTPMGRFRKIRAGINGCTFIHSSGFMASFETKEQAIEAARRVS